MVLGGLPTFIDAVRDARGVFLLLGFFLLPVLVPVLATVLVGLFIAVIGTIRLCFIISMNKHVLSNKSKNKPEPKKTIESLQGSIRENVVDYSRLKKEQKENEEYKKKADEILESMEEVI